LICWIGPETGAFLFTCPITRFKVQDWSDHDDPLDDRYEEVVCNACAGFHYVNPKTGKVLGEESE
jgi:hypothetical protein